MVVLGGGRFLMSEVPLYISFLVKPGLLKTVTLDPGRSALHPGP